MAMTQPDLFSDPRRLLDEKIAAQLYLANPKAQAAGTLADLYETDETAWLEAMAERIDLGRLDELDYLHLGEYLADMARRDRREVESRLTTLLAHVLKWIHQPDQRSRSWRTTIVVQRQELALLLDRGVLRHHAEAVLGKAYANAIERAEAETGLSAQKFSAECPYTLDQLLSVEVENPT